MDKADIILAVDTDLEVFEHQTSEWAKVGIGTQRMDTMYEAITLLLRGNVYFFAAINRLLSKL